MVANLKRRSFLAVVSAAALALLLAGAPMARAEMGKAMTANDLVAAANSVITTVTVDQAKILLADKSVVFLDVREPGETAKGVIPGAVLVPRGLLEFQATSALPDKDAKIVVYCKVGGRGALATETLNKMGYSAAVNMQGGSDAWLAAGGALR